SINFSGGNLAQAFSQLINVKAPSAVTVPTNPQGVKLTITASSGVFTGSFNEGSPARKVTFEGAFVRSSAGAFNEGRGFTLVPQDTDPKSPVLSGKVIINDNTE
ncbi:MAG TPA: hypothetical protein VD994_01855, partial [Prosthecobacter sp.]|nr:hypothetical protein [Prosthecobacter sp.]